MRAGLEYVDRKLKGRVDRFMSVEQPTKFELIFNLKTAKQIGLTISPNLLVRADRVIRYNHFGFWSAGPLADPSALLREINRRGDREKREIHG